MFDNKQRTVFTRLVGMQLVSVCVSLLIIGVLFGYLLQKYYFGVREWDLIEQGNTMVRLLQKDIVNEDIPRARERLYTLAESSDIELWIISESGSIVAGSQLAKEDPSLTLERAEVDHVLAGNNITKKVMGPDYQNLLVVLPVYDEGGVGSEIIGALAMRAPLGDVGGTVNQVMRLILIAGLVAGLVVFVISLSMAKGFAKPLEILKQATLDIAHGKFRELSIPAHSSEVDHLVEAFNYASVQIEETSRKQKRLEELRKEFLSDLSHELRAPLTSLKGFLELMENPLPLKQQEKYRRIMLEDTLYLERLAEDVLELSKMESGYFKLEKSWVSPQEVVERAIETLELRFHEKGVTPEITVSDDVPLLYVDPQRFHQVLLNLLINGIQHTKKDTAIRISITARDGRAIFELEDQGLGISQEHLPYIWERFYKLDKARTRGYQGSGLGLAIVREIVEAHGGTVEVESKEGEGTTFRLLIPLPK